MAQRKVKTFSNSLPRVHEYELVWNPETFKVIGHLRYKEIINQATIFQSCACIQNSAQGNQNSV